MTPTAFYFGCIKGNGAGHALYMPGLHSAYDESLKTCPWTVGRMDGGLLKNGKHPDVVDGRVFWTCGGSDWHAFIWWDRSGDSRANSNSGFYVRGFPLGRLIEDNVRRQALGAFAFAKTRFPEIVSRQRYPLTLV